MIKKVLFPGQEQDEKIISVIRKHWFNYLIFFIFAVIMMIPIVVVLVYWFLNPDIFIASLRSIMILIISAYILSSLAILLIGIVDYYLDIYILTDKRIVDINQVGLFNRQISEVHLHQIQDVNAKVQGFFETIFHFGDVNIQTAGEQSNFIFSTVPHPYTIAKRILELHEHHIGDCLEDSIGELEIKETENQLGLIKELQNVVAKLSLKSKTVKTIEGPKQRIADGEQKKMEVDIPKDVKVEKKAHHPTTPKKAQKSKDQKIDEEGIMKEGKEIGVK